MQPDLSEFSYGYALTSELMERYNLKQAGAPEFATQIAEAKPGGGWDMKLPGLAVFVQFKRSHRMVRKTAKEYGKFKHLPFYRMHLRASSYSRQHQLLIDLEKDGNVVLYAAPGFRTSRELSEAFVANAVAARSIFVRPSIVGPLPDNKPHHVAFIVGGPAYFCSRPRQIAPENIDELLTAQVAERLNVQPVVTSEEFFSRLSGRMLELAKAPSLGASDEELETLEALTAQASTRSAGFAGLLSRTLLDAELLIVTREP